jgi:hypothetical protein
VELAPNEHIPWEILDESKILREKKSILEASVG